MFWAVFNTLKRWMFAPTYKMVSVTSTSPSPPLSLRVNHLFMLTCKLKCVELFCCRDFHTLVRHHIKDILSVWAWVWSWVAQKSSINTFPLSITFHYIYGRTFYIDTLFLNIRFKVGALPFCDIFYIAKLTHFSLDFGFWVKSYL